MKNQFTSFENDYRNEVFNQSLDLDADFLSDLEKRLEEPKRKKKGLLFWWIFGASTLCTFVVYGMLQFRLGLNESWFNASIQTHKKQGSETARVSNRKSQTTEKIKGQKSKPMFSMSSVSDNSYRYAYQHLESTVFSDHSLPLYTGNP